MWGEPSRNPYTIREQYLSKMIANLALEFYGSGISLSEVKTLPIRTDRTAVPKGMFFMYLTLLMNPLKGVLYGTLWYESKKGCEK